MARPPSNGGGERKTLQYSSESNDKENEMRKHIREKRIRETGLQLSRPRGVLVRDHQNMEYYQVHGDKPVSMGRQHGIVVWPMNRGL